MQCTSYHNFLHKKIPYLHALQGNREMGARYLDPKYSRWISTDPALGEYVPQAPVNDEAKKHNQNLPGMGGLFNSVNLNLFHYAGNNPIKYSDPDGRLLQVAHEPCGLEKDYNDAITYLLSSTACNNIAKQIILDLEKNLDFTITIISGENGSCYYDSGNGKYLVWSRENVSYNKSTGIYNSVAITLFHELCHAWINNTEDGEKLFKIFVYKNLDTLNLVYENNPDYFIRNNMTRNQFYEEQFVTELEKKVGMDLEGMNRRNWYFELNGEYEINVNSVFEYGKVEM